MKTALCFITAVFLVKKASSVCTSASVIVDGCRYTNILQQKSFSEASRYCDNHMYGGYLAHIKSDTVSQAVDQLTRGCDQSFRFGLEYGTGVNGSGWYWIGFSVILSFYHHSGRVDPQLLSEDESRWDTGEGGESYNSSACVVPNNRTWIAAADDDWSQWFICETDLLAMQTEFEEIYMKFGENNYLNLAIRSIDGPVNITVYHDGNHFHSYPKLFETQIHRIELEFETGLYEFVGTRDDYSRTASTYIVMLAETCVEAPYFLNANIGPECAANSDLDTSCKITCNDGYYVVGISRATCVDTHPSNSTNFVGEWDYGDTECIPVICDEEPNFQNGEVAHGCVSGSPFSTSCNVTCNKGYSLSGIARATCVDFNQTDDNNVYGVWDYGDTLCKPMTCGEAPDFPNANIGFGCVANSSLGTSCNITCKDGYYMDGISRVTCANSHPSNLTNFEGEWDYGDTECIPITCDEEPNFPNGEISPGCVSGSPFSSWCNVTCNEGYSLSGIARATCVDANQTDDTNVYGVWEYGDTTCTPVTCGETPDIPNANFGFGCVANSFMGTSCNITCNDGYYVDGISRATCVDSHPSNLTNFDGEWDYGDTECIPYPCDDICSSECRDNRSCLCIDEICTEVCPSCGNNSECLELQCRCKKGYQGIDGDETNCFDIDECLDNKTCAAIGQSCQNLPGTYRCICNEGYLPSENRDECRENLCEPTDCVENAGCYNGSTCSCLVGFTGHPEYECFDVNECEEDVFACSDAEICHNTIGSYYCECIVGYTRSASDVCIPNTCPSDVIQCSSLNILIDLCDSAMDDVTNITFPSTLAGYSTISETTCGENADTDNTALGSRACELDGTWSTVTWLVSCETGLSVVASQSIESEEQRQKIAASLQILTSNPEKLNSSDVALTSGAIKNITNSATGITEITATSLISTISNVMESPGLEESGQSAELLAQLDLVASLLVLNKSDVYTSASRNVSVVVISSTSMEGSVGITMLVRPNSTTIGFRSDQFTLTTSLEVAGSLINGQRIQATIHIPEPASRNSSKLSFNVFGNTNLFSTNSTKESVLTPEADKKINVSMLVLSATVENRNITNLPTDGRLTYSVPLQYDNETQDLECVFWLESARNWDDEGCYMTGSTPNTLTCSCDHLTNFAALLRQQNDTTTSKGLRVVTIVGCSISTFALLILVLLFLCIPTTRTGKKFKSSFLLLNLSLALLGLNITLLISEMPFMVFPKDYSDISSSCRTIAAFLHAFLLASCAWMNCEGVLLVLAVVKPIYTAQCLKDVKVVGASVCWGWLMPTIFVAIVALVGNGVYEYLNVAGSPVTCWIASSKHIIYLAVIPVVLMISANLIAYAILTYQLCIKKNAKLEKSRNSFKATYQRKLGINFSILMLLGLTWIFGFFLPVIENGTAALPFAYIFTILNSLQGFFLLLLFVLRNEDVRQSFRIKLSTISEIFGVNSATSTLSDQSGAVNLSEAIGDSSSNTSRRECCRDEIKAAPVNFSNFEVYY